MDFDTYHNRILLCRIHHRIVDEQPHQYSVEDLRGIKAQHERWVRDRLHDLPEELGNAPIGLKPRYPSRGMLLPRLRTGKDAWLATIGSAFYLLEPVDEEVRGARAA